MNEVVMLFMAYNFLCINLLSKKVTMKNLFLAIALICSVNAMGQIATVNLQASGLTCSMCSNSINKALKSLDYVDDVKANIKNSTFEISFKPNAKIDFDQLKKKVEVEETSPKEKVFNTFFIYL